MSAEVVEPMIPPALQITISPLAHPTVSISMSEDDGDAFFDLFTPARDGETAQENPDASGLATPHDQQWPVTGLTPWLLANATMQPEILPTSPLEAAVTDASIGAQALIAPDISISAETPKPPDVSIPVGTLIPPAMGPLLGATTVSLNAPLPLPRSGALAGKATPRDPGWHSIPQAKVMASQEVISLPEPHPTTETATDAAGRRMPELRATEQHAVFAGMDAKTAPASMGKAPPAAPGRHDGGPVTQPSITEQVWVFQGLFATPPDSANEDHVAIVGDTAQSESHKKPTSLPNLAQMEKQIGLPATKTPSLQIASGGGVPVSNLPEITKNPAATKQALPRLAPQAQPEALIAPEPTKIAATTAVGNDAPVLDRPVILSPVAATSVVAAHGSENASPAAPSPAAHPPDGPQVYTSGGGVAPRIATREAVTPLATPADEGIVADPPIAAQPGKAENLTAGAAPLSQITVAATSTAAGQAVPPTAHQPLAPTLIAIAHDNSGPRTVELTLAPEELGNLRITIVPDGDTMRITLVAERPETLDLLRRHAAQLTQEFRQAGFSGTSLSFAQGGAGGFTGSHPPPDQTPFSLPEPASLVQAMPAGHRLGHAVVAGLDLRL